MGQPIEQDEGYKECVRALEKVGFSPENIHKMDTKEVISNGLLAEIIVLKCYPEYLPLFTYPTKQS